MRRDQPSPTARPKTRCSPVPCSATAVPQTTEHHYIRANQRAASARINAMLAGRARRPPTEEPPVTRAAIYARYSSDRQRDASIEDQVRLCRERVEAAGWTLVQTYVRPRAVGRVDAAAGPPGADRGRAAGEVRRSSSPRPSIGSAATRPTSRRSTASSPLPGYGSSPWRRARSASCTSGSRAR